MLLSVLPNLPAVGEARNDNVLNFSEGRYDRLSSDSSFSSNVSIVSTRKRGDWPVLKVSRGYDRWSEMRENMKIVLNILGALLVFVGGIWFLQGINVLPGSFMTGQTRWAVRGGIAAVAGIAVLLWANRKQP